MQQHNMIRIGYKQGCIIKQFKEKNCMTTRLGIDNSTMCFKYNLYIGCIKQSCD